MARKNIDNISVKTFVSNFNYKLLSTYRHAHVRITLECPNGHTENYLFGEFKRGKRCTACKKEEKRINKINKFKFFIENNSDYKFLELIGTRMLKLKCDKGHVYEVIWDSFKNGHRCPNCANNRKYKYEEVKKLIESHNYKLHSKEYKNANSYLTIECPNNHVYDVNFNSFRLGNRCQTCYLENNIGENSSHWKGGITPLHNYMREKINEWKLDSLKLHNYRCMITGMKSSKLEVHHLYGFSEILEETLIELNIDKRNEISKYNELELNSIERLLIKKHYQYGLGVPLLPEIHKQFHLEYGYGNNTPEQFNEFILKYHFEGGEKYIEKEATTI